MLSKGFLYFLRFYELCGFHTTSQLYRNSGLWITSLILALHICITIFITFYLSVGVIMDISHLPAMKLIDVVNFLIHFFSALATHWICSLETYKHRKVQQDFWKTLTEINALFCSQKNVIKRREVLISLVYVTSFYSLMAIAFIRERNTPNDTKFVYFFLLNHAIFRILYFLVYYNIVEFQLKKIEHELHYIANSHGSAASKINRNRFKWVCNYFHLVYKMSEYVNRMFGWTQFTTILLNFQMIFTYTNFAYRLFDESFFIDRSCKNLPLKFSPDISFIFYQLLHTRHSFIFSIR